MKNRKLLLIIMPLALAMSVLSGCGNITPKTEKVATSNNVLTNNPAEAPAVQPTNVPSNYLLQKFTWNVTGASDIQFSVVVNGTSFMISVTRYRGQSIQTSFPLDQSNSPNVYSMLRSVFTGMDGFVSSNTYGTFNGSYSSMLEIDTAGRALPPLISPVLYYGNTAVLTELFQFIVARL